MLILNNVFTGMSIYIELNDFYLFMTSSCYSIITNGEDLSY